MPTRKSGPSGELIARMCLRQLFQLLKSPLFDVYVGELVGTLLIKPRGQLTAIAVSLPTMKLRPVFHVLPSPVQSR